MFTKSLKQFSPLLVRWIFQQTDRRREPRPCGSAPWTAAPPAQGPARRRRQRRNRAFGEGIVKELCPHCPGNCCLTLRSFLPCSFFLVWNYYLLSCFQVVEEGGLKYKPNIPMQERTFFFPSFPSFSSCPESSIPSPSFSYTGVPPMKAPSLICIVKGSYLLIHWDSLTNGEILHW